MAVGIGFRRTTVNESAADAGMRFLGARVAHIRYVRSGRVSRVERTEVGTHALYATCR